MSTNRRRRQRCRRCDNLCGKASLLAARHGNRPRPTSSGLTWPRDGRAVPGVLRPLATAESPSFTPVPSFLERQLCRAGARTARSVARPPSRPLPRQFVRALLPSQAGLTQPSQRLLDLIGEQGTRSHRVGHFQRRTELDSLCPVNCTRRPNERRSVAGGNPASTPRGLRQQLHTEGEHRSARCHRREGAACR